jgi:pyruvate dehydrogenase E2 component (dihydrolipoamide acetyltransferase)
MAISKSTVPHFYVSLDVDMRAAEMLREQLRADASAGARPSFTDMVVRATALALKEYPRFNSAYIDGRLEIYPRINVAIAVAVADAVIAPVIHDTDREALSEIARQNRQLVTKVKKGIMALADLDGATFTVSNLGMYGVDSFAAVINPPQVASLAVGQVRTVPVIEEKGEIGVGRRMTLTLSCDHRVLMGVEAAEFLRKIQELLEQSGSLNC